MEEIRENSDGRQNTEVQINPWNYILQVAIKNLLKCLGLESEISSTSEEKEKKGVGETSRQEPPEERPADPSTADPPAKQPADQPADDPPVDPPAAPADPPPDPAANITASARATVGRTPARPPIGRGRGGQTN